MTATYGITLAPEALSRVSFAALRRLAGWALLAGLLGALIAASLILPSWGGPQFQNPDEMSNHIFVKAVAETGLPYYTDDLLPLDEENLLHPRGILTHDGRGVPFNYLGLPVVYGGLYRLIGEGTRYLGVALALTSFFVLYRAGALLVGARAWQAAAVMLATAPLVYYFNHPFMNATPAITAALVGFWLLARYHRRSRRSDLLGAALAFALSMLFRYEYVLFLVPFALIFLCWTHRGQVGQPLLRDAGIVLAVVVLAFLLPVLVLDALVYGHPLTYGYHLFNAAYFPERNPGEGLPVWTNLYRGVRGVLLPSYPVDLPRVGFNLLRLSFGLIPVETAIGIAAVGVAIWQRRLSRWAVLSFAALAAYIAVYRGAGGTWLASEASPTLETSVVRYWLPLYAGVAFLNLCALASLRDRAAQVTLCVALAGTGLLTLLYMDPSVLDERSGMVAVAANYEPIIKSTPEDSLIYCSSSDGRILPYRDVAAWYEFDAQAVAASMARLYETGRPIYVVQEREVDIAELDAELRSHGLTLRAESLLLHRVVRLEPVHCDPPSADPSSCRASLG